MSGRWFRWHADSVDDHKLQALPCEAFKFYVNLASLLCSDGSKDGTIPCLEQLGWRLRMTLKEAQDLVTCLFVAGLLVKSRGSLYVKGWSKRQYISDSSTERVKKHRSMKRSETVTVTSPDTEQIQIQIQNRTEKKETRARRASPSGFDEFWNLYPHKVGKAAALKALSSALRKTSIEEICAGVERYKATKPPDRQWCNPATWLNQERWLDQPASTAQGPPRKVHFGILDEMIAEGEQNGASFIEDRRGNVVDLSEVRRGSEVVYSAPCDTEPRSEGG